jgi:ArsR family transcriptional regulator
MKKHGLKLIYPSENMPANELMKLVQIYRCLCDETRLRILHPLKQGPLCVCHSQETLQLPQVAVSKHLAYLRRTGMVEARRHEQWMIYSLPPSPGRELDLQLSCLQDCVQTEPAFRADLRRLKALGPKCDWVPQALGATVPAKKVANPGCASVRCAA